MRRCINALPWHRDSWSALSTPTPAGPTPASHASRRAHSPTLRRRDKWAVVSGAAMSATPATGGSGPGTPYRRGGTPVPAFVDDARGSWSGHRHSASDGSFEPSVPHRYSWGGHRTSSAAGGFDAPHALAYGPAMGAVAPRRAVTPTLSSRERAGGAWGRAPQYDVVPGPGFVQHPHDRGDYYDPARDSGTMLAYGDEQWRSRSMHVPAVRRTSFGDPGSTPSTGRWRGRPSY
jgi:hypothetical protein